MRKPRSDSKLMTLDAELQREIFQRLQHEGYEDVRIWLKKEKAVKTSNAALNKAYQYWSRQDLENRVLKSRGAAKDIQELVAGDRTLLDTATQAALQQRVFELAMSGGDADTIKDFSTLLLKARKLDYDQQALELKVRQYEDQIKSAKAELENAKSKGDGGLDIETIERIEQQLNML